MCTALGEQDLPPLVEQRLSVVGKQPSEDRPQRRGGTRRHRVLEPAVATTLDDVARDERQEVARVVEVGRERGDRGPHEVGHRQRLTAGHEIGDEIGTHLGEKLRPVGGDGLHQGLAVPKWYWTATWFL